MILLLDNYDSFVHNLARYLRLLGHQVQTVRNDHLELSSLRQDVSRGVYQAIVMSPGPCTPDQAGICLAVVRHFHQHLPILGVCLGHQVIVQALGGLVRQWDQPIHGRSDWIYHDGKNEFAGLPSPLRAARYHSLAAQENRLPDCLEVSARLSDGTIMAVRHHKFPVVGFQFHPESILTEFGLKMLQGFLRVAGLPYLENVDVGQRTCEMPEGCRPLTEGASK